MYSGPVCSCILLHNPPILRFSHSHNFLLAWRKTWIAKSQISSETFSYMYSTSDWNILFNPKPFQKFQLVVVVFLSSARGHYCAAAMFCHQPGKQRSVDYSPSFKRSEERSLDVHLLSQLAVAESHRTSEFNGILFWKFDC